MARQISTPRTITRFSLRQRRRTQSKPQIPTKQLSPVKEKRKYTLKPKFKFFTRLPAELRLKIWHFAIPDPRIINLHVHIPMKTPYMGPYMPLTNCKGISFTASILPCEEDIKIRRIGPLYYSAHQSEWRMLHSDKAAPPPAPSMLSACSESREVALQYYSLAFGGKHFMPYNRQFQERWDRYALGEKKTWVDFRRDVIFLEVMNVLNIQIFMQILAAFARDGEDGSLGRIRRLGIGGWWATDSNNWYNEVPKTVSEPKFEKTFGALEELLVWDDLERKGGVQPSTYQVSAKDVVEGQLRRTFEGMREKGRWREDRSLPAVRVMRDGDRIGDDVK